MHLRTRQALKLLRYWLPLWHPATVRCVRNLTFEGQRMNGLCWPVEKNGKLRGFKIQLDFHVHPREQTECLVHEWAHALTWAPDDSALERKQHGPEFGVAYARAYGTVFEGTKGE